MRYLWEFLIDYIEFECNNLSRPSHVLELSLWRKGFLLWVVENIMQVTLQKNTAQWLGAGLVILVLWLQILSCLVVYGYWCLYVGYVNFWYH